MANLTQELIQNIDSALYLWEAITLKELIEFYPIEKMAEVYTYLQIACHSPAHEIEMEEETIVIKDNGSEQISEVTMQKITFYRQEVKLAHPSRKSGQHIDFSNVSKLKIRHVSLVA
jgi:hypothetical protein